MGKARIGSDRVVWAELVNDDEFRGMWVALEDARYDPTSRQPLDGVLVDADEDLAALCSRIQTKEQQGCSIHFCDDGGSGIRRSVM